MHDNTLPPPQAGSPWHAGERALHDRIGVLDRMEKMGRHMVHQHMPEQHQAFYAQLPFMVVATVDPTDRPWATLVHGEPGFVHVPSASRLALNTPFSNTDPAATGIADGKAIGMLGIELQTRRRNRVNGLISKVTDTDIDVDVQQTMGNCPKYIQVRDFSAKPTHATHDPGSVETLSPFSAVFQSLVASADTFFVSTYADIDGHRSVDASHRGGKPGFVQVATDGELTIPDFNGNKFFNTLGNIHLTHRAGLVFPDFETGDVLQLTGNAEIDHDETEAERYPGAERMWRVRPTEILLRRNAIPTKWMLQEPSPHNAPLGPWE